MILTLVVGITNTGEAVFYDVVDMNPTSFDLKKEESPTTATTQNAIGDIQGDSTTDNVSQENPVVKQQYSLSDSDGNQLTNEQAEYFKDSKIRDEKGDLMVMYHGSPGTFTVFDKKKAKSSGYYGTVQENLGHATASFTLDIYGHVTEKMKQDSANRMEQFIKSVKA